MITIVLGPEQGPCLQLNPNPDSNTSYITTKCNFFDDFDESEVQLPNKKSQLYKIYLGSTD
jgi:hypothetical protein